MTVYKACSFVDLLAVLICLYDELSSFKLKIRIQILIILHISLLRAKDLEP